MTKFYVISEADNDDAFIWCGEEGVPATFDTEEEAITTAKQCAPSIVVKSTTAVSLKPASFRVEKLK